MKVLAELYDKTYFDDADIEFDCVKYLDKGYPILLRLHALRLFVRKLSVQQLKPDDFGDYLEENEVLDIMTSLLQEC